MIKPAVITLCLLVLLAGCTTPSGDDTEQPRPQPVPTDPAARVTFFEQALESEPSNAELHYQLGNAFFDLGQFQEACRTPSMLGYERTMVASSSTLG